MRLQGSSTGGAEKRYERYCKIYLDIKEKEERNIDFCVAIGDIDFFKKVNDTYGHEWGDMVLTQIARVMKKHMVGKGIVARWGGEEFLFLFNNCMLEEAVALLDETLSEIRDIEIEIDETNL